MLSALLATNAIPRRIHIVPSVMMNGCTPRPDHHPAVDRAADETDAERDPEREERPWPTGAKGPANRRTIAVVTPASA